LLIPGTWDRFLRSLVALLTHSTPPPSFLPSLHIHHILLVIRRSCFFFNYYYNYMMMIPSCVVVMELPKHGKEEAIFVQLYRLTSPRPFV
jgi:hypothetical protein